MIYLISYIPTAHTALNNKRKVDIIMLWTNTASATENALGFIPDYFLPEVFASYGGLVRSVYDKEAIIGSSNPVQIDQFGNNLASA
jgi:hypothetical protein